VTGPLQAIASGFSGATTEVSQESISRCVRVRVCMSGVCARVCVFVSS
jgi:hypothetical protein